MSTLFGIFELAVYNRPDRGPPLNQIVSSYSCENKECSKVRQYLTTFRIMEVNRIRYCYGLSIDRWESLLPKDLYSIRTLLRTATNSTPHERFFSFSWRSSMGTSLRSWLSQSGTVLLRCHARHGKQERLTDKLELIGVRYPDEKKYTVTLRDLVSAGKEAGPVAAQEVPAMLSSDTWCDDFTDSTPWSSHKDYLEGFKSRIHMVRL